MFEWFLKPTQNENNILSVSDVNNVVLVYTMFKILFEIVDLRAFPYQSSFDSVSQISFETVPIALNNIGLLSGICNYFNSLTFFELSDNGISLTDCLPFLQRLFSRHPIKSFTFNRNPLFNTEDGVIPIREIVIFEQILQLLCNSGLQILELSANNVSDSMSPDRFVEIVVSILKDSTLKMLTISYNGLNDQHLLALIIGLPNIRYWEFALSNPNTLPHLFKALSDGTTYVSSLNLCGDDDDDDDDEQVQHDLPSHVLTLLEATMSSNHSLVECQTPWTAFNHMVAPYLEINLNRYWSPKTTSCFSDNFFKVLMTFLLSNNQLRVKSQPNLPLIMCNTIFGFLQNKMFQ
jgi:hypothetical protein